MARSPSFGALVVFAFSIGGYVPLSIGGWQHPSEMNLAAYGIWLIIAALLVYSSWKQGFAGLLLPFGFCVGNSWMLALGLWRGGYTFNLGQAEAFALYGLVLTLSLWAAVGTKTGTWSPRILYLGAISAEAISYYPQWKQYLVSHERPTWWLLAGWCISMTGVLVNIVFVEGLPGKFMMTDERYWHLHPKEKRLLPIFEESAFSIENLTLGSFTIFLMAR